jgi:hypothetical protein
MDVISDAIDLLIDDHRFMEVLLEQLDLEDDPAEMRRLFARLAENLAARRSAPMFPAACAARTVAPGR